MFGAVLILYTDTIYLGFMKLYAQIYISIVIFRKSVKHLRAYDLIFIIEVDGKRVQSAFQRSNM